MNAIICFFRDILMLNKEDRVYIGLERLNKDRNNCNTNKTPSVKKRKREIKLSDLMQHGS